MEMREKVGKSRFTVFFRKRSRELFPEFGRLLLFYFFQGGGAGLWQTILFVLIQLVYGISSLLNFTSSWDFGIFREYWISRSRCNVWCSLPAQGSHEKTSASWFASVCTGSAFHKRNWSN